MSTALDIYNASTDPEQREQVLGAVTIRGAESAEARAWVRRQLGSPRRGGSYLVLTANHIEKWGTEKDAEHLGRLAEEYPAIGDDLRERARMIRRRLRELEDPESAHAAELEAERERMERDKRLLEEAEKKAGDG